MKDKIINIFNKHLTNRKHNYVDMIEQDLSLSYLSFTVDKSVDKITFIVASKYLFIIDYINSPAETSLERNSYNFKNIANCIIYLISKNDQGIKSIEFSKNELKSINK